jgi:hypothetical protein
LCCDWPGNALPASLRGITLLQLPLLPLLLPPLLPPPLLLLLPPLLLLLVLL